MPVVCVPLGAKVTNYNEASFPLICPPIYPYLFVSCRHVTIIKFNESKLTERVLLPNYFRQAIDKNNYKTDLNCFKKQIALYFNVTTSQTFSYKKIVPEDMLSEGYILQISLWFISEKKKSA